ncbi:MAG: hypothetical protein ACKV2Q_09610, partial [Planctomycetaceae bacterium]
NGEVCKSLPGLAGGAFADGREYEPRVVRVLTGLPDVPALQQSACAPRVTSNAPKLELKRP